ncbi:hypothetical protein [Empedobacter brevis]|uniref:hypothetical protein n=1 Tax=Empedobacter brevis TaxID=247 RepID=UPI003341193C
MKKNDPIIGLFFSIILFSIPIFNQLHFSLIDHSQEFSNQKKEMIHHQCQHFIFYTIFLDTHDEPKIEVETNEEFYQRISFDQVEKIKFSAIEFHFTRGPPIFKG